MKQEALSGEEAQMLSHPPPLGLGELDAEGVWEDSVWACREVADNRDDVMGKERPLLQRCSGLTPSLADKQFWTFCLLAVMWSFQRVTCFSLDVASPVVNQPDKMTVLTFCLCCHLHAQNIILKSRHSVFHYPEKESRLPAEVFPVCPSRYVHDSIPKDFFLTSPIITCTSGSTKIWQFQQRFLLQEILMGIADSNLTPGHGACVLDISGQTCTMWMESREWCWFSPFGKSIPLCSLSVCQHKACHGT